MSTVITHFYNEAKMLPFWLQHHTKMFDNGILIDHNSTDDSVEICRRFAPHWKVVKTKLSNFSAIDTDFEVMMHESSVTGWKMALNVTEFLHFPGFATKLQEAQERGVMAIRTRGICMVDKQEGEGIDPHLPLLEQKHHGFVEMNRRLLFNIRYLGFQNQAQVPLATRERIIHRYPTGAYHPGRHKTFHKIDEKPQGVFTLWYGYSPWVEWNIIRKMAICSRIPEIDKKQGRGLQHLRSKEKLQADYLLNKRLAYDILPFLEGKKALPNMPLSFLRVSWALLRNHLVKIFPLS